MKSLYYSLKISRFSFYILISVVFLFASCNNEKIKIAVSQCSDGIWRQQMIGEIKQEANLQENIELIIAQSNGSVTAQQQQIEQLINQNIDLLIVSPVNEYDFNESFALAEEKGIPVLLVDRKINSDNYTAYIAGDNVAVGQMAAQYIFNNIYTPLIHSGEHTRIVEFQGSNSCSPVQDRHKGFASVMDSVGIAFQSFPCQWQRNLCQHFTDSLLRATTDKIIFFCHNDGMAFDVFSQARKMGMQNRISLVGVDALIGDGVDMIERGEMVASVRYPTCGREAMLAAIKILNSKITPPNKRILISPLIVDSRNVEAIKIQDQRILELANNNNILSDKLIGSRQQLAFSKTICFILITVIICFFIAGFIYHQHVQRLQKKADQTLQKFLKEKLEGSQESSHKTDKSAAPDNDYMADACTDDFMTRLNECLSAHLSNADITSDDIAVALHMGRNRFYQQVKSHTGYSPKELLRIARLKQAALLLEQTDHSVKEICYLVGFSTPSYFAKSFRAHYGMLPNEYKNKKN